MAGLGVDEPPPWLLGMLRPPPKNKMGVAKTTPKYSLKCSSLRLSKAMARGIYIINYSTYLFTLLISI